MGTVEKKKKSRESFCPFSLWPAAAGWQANAFEVILDVGKVVHARMACSYVTLLRVSKNIV